MSGKISLKLKQKPTAETEKTYYLAEGMMTSHFYKEYLEGHASEAIAKKVRKYWKDIDEEEGEPLEYRVFAVPNANDSVVEYTECWLLDNEDGYLPIFIGGINTSSCYAACRCGMDREIEECDDVKTEYTLDEICECLVPSVKKDTFKGVVIDTLGCGRGGEKLSKTRKVVYKAEIEEVKEETYEYKYLKDQYDIQKLVYRMNGELKAENEKLKEEIAILRDFQDDLNTDIEELKEENDAHRSQLHRTLTENEKLKAEIALVKAPLLEKANTLMKKTNPNLSVSEKNSVSQLQELILELETATSSP
jgi:hypothetical protein